MNLVPLFEEALEFQNYNGTVLSNGKAAVYYIGRTRLADIYNDVAAEYPAENPRILNNLGMGPVYVNPAFDYELVVFDEYNNELFSVKKYLHSKGEHSTANVVVTPSENIAVSAWTVGDVQVYMPYLTGQLGKVYEGIDPIVVNNTEDKISANHVPLGVQDPLYFVQDDEEGCIIGFSGQTVPDGVMTESALEFENNKITGYNGSAFSAGNEYEAGSYVSIDNNTISVTGLQPEGDYAYNSALSSKLDVTATGQFLTGLPEDLVYTADITGLATTAQLNEKLDKSDSGNFYPMDSNPSGYLTAVDIPESAVWNATTQTVSANSAQWAGGTANPQIPVTGINGIKISESGDKVVFEVSGDYYPGNNPSGFITGVDLSDYATTAQVSEKLDTTAFSTVSSDFLQSDDITGKQDVTGMTAYQPVGDYYSASNPSGFITGVDLSDYATTAELADKQDITGMTAYQPVGNYQTAGDYLTTADSANFYTTANESGFITGVDLTPYQLTADMTAYQPVGDYLTTGDSANFYPMTGNPSGFINELPEEEEVEFEEVDLAAYQPVSSMTAYQSAGDYYSASNPSGFITGVPAGTMNESSFSYDASNNITAYNGSAFKAGDEFPQSATEAIGYITATSANIDSTIDNVSANSGVWGGSALPVSAGPGIKVNLVDNTLVFSNDETVLFENWDNPIRSTTATGSLAEPLTSFASFEVTWAPWGGRGEPRWEPVTQKFPSYPSNSACYYPLFAPWLVEGDGGTYLFMELFSANDTNFCIKEGRFYQYTTTVTGKTTAMDNTKIYKIVGINHTAGGN